jgi:hypothetical protein
MYTVDDRDRVFELKGVPQSNTGAPLPVVLSDEHRVLLAYLVLEPDPTWDGTSPKALSQNTPGMVALIDFASPCAHFFGPPNDEAFTGHPLAPRGLHPYAAFEVKSSSWVRRLERMNAVHPYHRPELFASLRHFVFSFHDSTFECVADGFQVSIVRGSIRSAVQKMTEMLRGDMP